MTRSNRRCDQCHQVFDSEQALRQHQRDTGHAARHWSQWLSEPKALTAVGATAVILVVGILGYAFLGGSGRSPMATGSSALGARADRTAEAVGTSVGKRAPEFSLTSIDGNRIPYDSDKPKVIFFMAAWCGSCIPEERALGELHRQYGDRVQIISVDADPQNDTEADTRRFQKQYGGPWPHALSGKMARLFRVKSLDTTLVLNRNNVITYRDAHPTGRPTLKRAIMKVLPSSS